MGAYLSEPKTNKDSLDVDSVRVKCGASSMQGWRTSQEDAHNCIMEFDKNAALFAVYDGHGGHEVAEYCSKKLPDFIKQTENYIKGNYEQALKDAFLEFDATLTTPEVLNELKKIAGTKDGDSNSDADAGSDSEGEEAVNLVQEAHMPLDEVMAKYKVKLLRGLKGEGKPPVSPMLRGRRTPSDGAGCSSSAGAGPSCSSVTESGDGEVSSSSNTQELCNGDVHMNGEVESKTEDETEVESSSSTGTENVTKEKGVSPSKEKGVSPSKEKSVSPSKEKSVSPSKEKGDSVEKCEADSGSKRPEPGLINGESHDVDVTSSTENGSAKSAEGITSTSPLKKRRSNLLSAEIYQKLLQYESDSEEEEDETFTADHESEAGSSDDNAENTTEECAEGCEEDCEEEDSSVADSEDEDEEDIEADYSTKEVPGSDSGSTAVVALLVESQLYVANAGDSRCVVGRDGQAVEMSFDHKPEDEPERTRIEGAGGIVSADGRVNNGLNLSRAIGDHSYKQSKDLPASEQMITALPDVKTLQIDPDKDKFMVIACDGIWNSMSSQEVVEFVNTKLEQKTERLSQICEELFDHCLAPNTLGDGTGCDNMTCVIVQFKHWATQKRPAEETEEPSAKRSKVEEETPAS